MGEEMVAEVDTTPVDGTAPTGGALQMIDGKGEFNSSMDDFAPEGGGEDQMLVVTALGVRGSGKSTVLNEVFGTGFELGKAFSSSKGTKGAWVQSVKQSEKPLVVLDTQGGDGRGTDMERVNRVAKFTLMFSDVVLFNVWFADIGRYEAAGYGMIRTIFHEYLKLFEEEEEKPRTLMMFVIKDHDENTSLESLEQILQADLQALWKQVAKPSNCEQMELSELFDFQFYSLPHMRHRKAQFDEGIEKLRSRFFDSSDPSFAMQAQYSKNNQLDSFGTYSAMVWNELSDTEAEQPARRELIAAYRCDVAYHHQHGLAMKQLGKWTSEVDGGKLVSRFGKEASKMIDTRMDDYDVATSMHANSPARMKKRNELDQLLRTNVTGLFRRQMLVLRSQSLQKLKDILLSNVFQSSNRNNSSSLNTVLEWFSTKAEDLVVPSLHLSFYTHKMALQESLTTYAQQFADSPAVQLTAMQRYERRAQRPIRRQPDARISLNLTGALRPRGYGNFQLVSGYSNGPLAMNFSACNDADAAEQEGHGKVPLFRFQPTLHYDLDL